MTGERLLLERDEQLATLHQALTVAVSGKGSLILLGGEAGIGKTGLVRTFASKLKNIPVITGACDPLPAPPALGPVLDIAVRLGAAFGPILDGSRSGRALFPAVLSALEAVTTPLVLVFEDMHWADQASIEMVGYLGRRVERLRLLLIVTFRPGEASAEPGGQLALMLGDLASTPGVVRMTLGPLSRAATAVLAQAGPADVDALYRLTGGNPFFVTEVLGARSQDIPPTVRDAVLARVGRLTPEARHAIEAAAAIGVRMEPGLLARVMQAAGVPRWSMHEAINAGVLELQGSTLVFRHELVQAAIAGAIPPEAAQRLHASILAELQRGMVGPDDYAILTRHAEAAGDDRLVLELAPLAAMRATALGAHREAAQLYGQALERARDQPALMADLFEQRGARHYASRRFLDAMNDHRSAAGLCRNLGDRLGEARNLIRCAYLSLAGGDRVESEAALSSATSMLEQLPPSRELAIAYEARSRRLFVSNEPRLAEAWARRAVALAAQLGDAELSLEAGVTATVSRLQLGDDDDAARTELQELREAAHKQSLTDASAVETYARVTFYLAFIPMLHRCYEDVDRYLDEGLRYARDHDLEYWQSMLSGVQVLRSLDAGRWRDATEQAQLILKTPDPAWRARFLALICLARVKARTGQSDAMTYFDQATHLASSDRALVGMISPARAEAGFLAGDNARVLRESTEEFSLSSGAGDPWLEGELAFWTHLAGGAIDANAGFAEPYRLGLLGNWAGAAQFWQERSCPYEMAVTVASGNDPAAVRSAIALLDQLGAAPAAAYARQRLRELGIAHVSRGPRPSTRANPAGLTRREQEVLALVASGHTNVEIAARLFVSAKTVERHLAGIFAKLHVDSRGQATEAAMRLGALPPGSN